jgi:hypothetical protein
MDRGRRAHVPGAPIGIAVGRDELRVVSGYGGDNDRYVYRCPRPRLQEQSIECSDLSGAQAAVGGDTLMLSQAASMRILSTGEPGAAIREVRLEAFAVISSAALST